MSGDGSGALWALALLVALLALWAGRGVVVPLVCAVALAVLVSPTLRHIDKLFRLRKVAVVVRLGLASALAGVLAMLVQPVVLAASCESCRVPEAVAHEIDSPQPGTVAGGGAVDDTASKTFGRP